MSGFWSSETLKSELPRLIHPYQVSHVVNAAYELSMGDQAWVTTKDQQASRLSVNLKEGERVSIPAGQFAQLQIYESITIPDNAVGLISMKSRVKMRGLVNVSGFHVDPGYRGKLVFAVFNAGSSTIVLKQREPTFLLWYVSLDRRTKDLYSGSRQNSTDIESDQLMSLDGPTYNPTALAERVAALERRRSWWRQFNLRALVAALMLIVGLLLGEAVGLLEITSKMIR